MVNAIFLYVQILRKYAEKLDYFKILTIIDHIFIFPLNVRFKSYRSLNNIFYFPKATSKR